ncbi:MAG: ParB/RepB/Spo0J family partition protein [Candidatus Margulisbacteria bacterium]|nr:ParB/RepB/Spo0J family partition protein [Candidatus Margulisiibacteriota bacterium]
MSSSIKPRLGKGLEALIPKSFLASGKTVINIPITEIKPNAFQPRLHFDADALRSLSESIKQHGLAQPVLVRRSDIGYELIAGERRYRACLLVGLEVIPAIVKDMSDRESLKIALIENLERENLTPIEEAKGYQRLMGEFEMTHQALAEMFSKSRSAVTNKLRLLKLPELVQRALNDGSLSEGHARSLLSLEAEVDILSQFQKLRENQVNVRELEKIIAGSSPKSSKSVEVSDRQLGLFGQMESQLTDKFKMPFKIKPGRRGGKVEIKFSSQAELRALYQALTTVYRS